MMMNHRPKKIKISKIEHTFEIFVEDFIFGQKYEKAVTDSIEEIREECEDDENKVEDYWLQICFEEALKNALETELQNIIEFETEYDEKVAKYDTEGFEKNIEDWNQFDYLDYYGYKSVKEFFAYKLSRSQRWNKMKKDLKKAIKIRKNKIKNLSCSG